MKTIFTISLLFFSLHMYSQKELQIDQKIDSLKNVKIQLEREIQSIERNLKDLEEQRTMLQFEKSESFDYVIKQKLQIRVRDKDNSSGNIIYEPKNGETLRLLGYDNDTKCWSVSVNGKFGYVNEVFLEGNPQIDEYRKNINIIKSKEDAEQQKMRALAKNKELIDKYGTSNAQRIARHEYWIGMTDDMAKTSIGSPNDINRTVGEWGVHEQWVYDNRDLYLS